MSDPHVAEPQVLELSPDEVIRVLAVRPRARQQLHEPPRTEETAPRGMTTLVSGPAATRPAPSKPVTLSLVPDDVPARGAAPAATPATKSSRRERSLEETIDDLQSYAFGLEGGESDDTGSTTGVRHLRIEIDRPMKGAKRR